MCKHPKVTKTVKKIVSVSKEKEIVLFRQELKKLIDAHLVWVATWGEANKNLFYGDDITPACQLAFDEWENEEQLFDERVSALCNKQTQMNTEIEKIMEEEEATLDQRILNEMPIEIQKFLNESEEEDNLEQQLADEIDKLHKKALCHKQTQLWAAEIIEVLKQGEVTLDQRIINEIDALNQRNIHANGIKVHNYSGVKDSCSEPDKKDIIRLENIKNKSQGNASKAISLANSMASAIKDKDKALRRANAALSVFKDNSELAEELYGIFMKRFGA